MNEDGKPVQLEQLRTSTFNARRKNLLSRLFKAVSERSYRARSATLLDDCFFRCLDSLNIRYLLECGAREAAASARFAKDGRRAIAIEANPLTFASHTIRVAGDSIEVLNIGLGSQDGELSFYIPKHNKMSGSATFQPKQNVPYEVQKVPVTTVDNLVASRIPNTEDTIAMWVDVEGFARDVLRGASTTLDSGRCWIIKIEVEDFPFFKDQALSGEIRDFMNRHGFEPVLFDFEYDLQYNIIFARKEVLDRISAITTSTLSELKMHSFNVFQLIKFSKPFKRLRKNRQSK